jgi:hypothetical protein
MDMGAYCITASGGREGPGPQKQSFEGMWIVDGDDVVIAIMNEFEGEWEAFMIGELTDDGMVLKRVYQHPGIMKFVRE